MRAFFYTLFIVAFGAFIVGCGDLDYVDDYSDSTFYDDEYADEEAEDENQYAQEEADEEVVTIANALSTKNNESKQVKNIKIGEKTAPKEPQKVAQPTPAPQPAPQPTPKQTPQPAPQPVLQSVPQPAPATAPQATAKADSQGITKIDDSTFEYNGMVFKHNLGKDADLNAILAVLNKGQSQTPKAEPKSIDSPKVARDSRPAIVPSAPSSTSNASVSKQKIRGKGFKGLTQSTAKLKAQCENNGNIQKCEDLGRIYALRGNIGSAVAYYERACDNGNGSALSCFFLSQIYANDGNSDTAQHYTSMIDESALRNKKVGSMELRLSTGKVASVKRSLKMSCTKGDEGSCNTLQSIFKMRGETSEMKTYFGTECWRGSVLGCNILRSI